ncbi:hypothetical protein VDG1235_2875 [Verrucomicrobiia bacterium DG1235]|nr:hypothetical protein VDG1235_2875 [Verrucomicrobiae bacterium DG1235]
MKKTISTLAALAFAANAMAHTSGLPHLHNGAETNWTPAIACVALLSVAALVVLGLRHKKDRAK